MSDRCPSSSKSRAFAPAHVRGQPLPVRERHHAVLRALPHGDGHADLREVESPRAHERDVVVEPAPDARRDRLVQHRRSRARRTRRSAPPRRPARPSRRAPPRDRRGVARSSFSASISRNASSASARLDGRAQLLDVLLRHAGEEVEPVRAERTDARGGGARDDAVRQQRRARERVRTSARLPGRVEALGTQVRRRSGRCRRRNRPPNDRARASIPRSPGGST